MRTDRVVFLLQLALARGVVRHEEIRPGNQKWERKRISVLSALERELTLAHFREEAAMLHASAPLATAAGVDAALSMSRACDVSRFRLKQATFPWLQLRTPEEIEEAQLEAQVGDVEQLNRALKRDKRLVAAVEKATGGMLERFRQHLAEQGQKVREGGASQAALEAVQAQIDRKKAEAEERRRRLGK